MFKPLLNMEIRKKLFETYIPKVLKQISKRGGITLNSKQQLNSVICTISESISLLSFNLTKISGKKTISEKEVQNAIKILFTGELLKHSLREGIKSVDTFNSETDVKCSRQDKAGIIFPPSIAENFLRNFGFSVTRSAPIFLATVLEFIVSEILGLSSRLSASGKRNRITIKDLHLSVINDPELSDLFYKLNIHFMGGGVKDKTKHLLTLPKISFETLIRSMVNADQKISKDVFPTLQYFIEQYITGILLDSNNVAIHCGKDEINPSDIQVVYEMRNSNVFGFSLNKINI